MVLGVVVAFIILAVISPVGRSFIFYYWMGLKANWMQERAMKEILNDKYGGKTPQETINLYLDALRKGDMELAAKYIFRDPSDPRRWEEYRDYLKFYKDDGVLSEYLALWDRIEKEKTIESEFKERITYSYSVWQEESIERFEYPDGDVREFVVPTGYYGAQFVLLKLPEPNNLWKFLDIPL